MADVCDHLNQVELGKRQAVNPSGPGCKECLEKGSRWVQLRLCLTCGHVGCCDSSPNRHATAHFHETGHPVIKAFEPGQSWAWCYVDEASAAHIPAFPDETPSRHCSPPRGGAGNK